MPSDLRRGPPGVPTAVAVALARVGEAGFRLVGAQSEANVGAVRYLTRRGTISIEKARSLIGYEPAVDLEEGMRRTREWTQAEGLV